MRKKGQLIVIIIAINILYLFFNGTLSPLFAKSLIDRVSSSINKSAKNFIAETNSFVKTNFHQSFNWANDNISRSKDFIQNSFEKYPATTTLVFTGDPFTVSAVSNYTKFVNPKAHNGVDGFISGSYILEPIGYNASNFLSGASGEKLTWQGFGNYCKRFTLGQAMGVAYGVSNAWVYSENPYAAAGGTIVGALWGGYVGTLSPAQAKDMESTYNNFKQKISFGLAKKTDNGIIPTPFYLIDQTADDLKYINQASWDFGHKGKSYWRVSGKLNQEIGTIWAMYGITKYINSKLDFKPMAEAGENVGKESWNALKAGDFSKLWNITANFHTNDLPGLVKDLLEGLNK